MAAVPPGWYADASKPGFERWWDGGSWSEVTRPTPLPTAQPERAPVGRSTPDGVPVANPWRRLGAVILDYLLIGIVVGTLGAPLVRDLSDKLNALLDQVQAATAAGQPPPDVTTFWSDNFGPVVKVAALHLAVAAIYVIPMTKLRGATLGKMATGIRVRPLAAEGLPSWGQAVLRFVGFELLAWVLQFVVSPLGALYLLLDGLWCVWDPRRQCLHDKIAGTAVVYAVRSR